MKRANNEEERTSSTMLASSKELAKGDEGGTDLKERAKDDEGRTNPTEFDKTDDMMKQERVTRAVPQRGRTVRLKERKRRTTR